MADKLFNIKEIKGRFEKDPEELFSFDEELELIRHTQETIVKEIAYIKGAIEMIAFRLNNLESSKYPKWEIT